MNTTAVINGDLGVATVIPAGCLQPTVGKWWASVPGPLDEARAFEVVFAGILADTDTDTGPSPQQRPPSRRQ